MPQPVPPDLVFFFFFINLGNFNRQKPGFWRKASGPEHKLLREPATQAVSLQAPFQSELICKQMQGLLLRPVDCSESLSLCSGQVISARYSIIMQETRYNPSGKWSEVGPHDRSLHRMTIRFSSWRVMLFVMISGNVTSHIVLSLTVRVTQSVMFFPWRVIPRCCQQLSDRGVSPAPTKACRASAPEGSSC